MPVDDDVDSNHSSIIRMMTRRDMIKMAMLSGSAIPLAVAGAESDKGLPATDKDLTVLAQRAIHFRQLILDVAKGPGGMIIAFLPFDTRRPFQEGETLHPYLVGNLDRAWGKDSPKPTTAEWYYGENTLWATGWFLYSQILRYRVTREPEALQTAQKCFRDLSNIFRLSRSIEPGLLGKPHGGRAGPTTSYDQSACPVLFYTLYAQELATPEEKAEAVKNMAQHGEYFIRRNWTVNHHGHLQKIAGPGGGHTSLMKYLACVYAAYQLSGETRFRDEAFKHLRQLIEVKRLPWPSNPYEVNHNLCYYAFLCDFWSKTEMGGEYDWQGCIKQYWEGLQKSFDAKGLPRFGPYNTTERTFTPYETSWDPVQKKWQSATLQGNYYLNCNLAAVLALIARARGLDDKAHLSAKRILLQLEENTLRWWGVYDDKFPEEMKPILNIFGSEVPAAWLTAYWLGRSQGAW
jgi:hypothetical protein